jgi:hypothetical protein
MRLPSIHSNGTGRDSLIKQYDELSKAFNTFVKKWEEIDFHARDYYIQGQEAWMEAFSERRDQSENLMSVSRYINEIREHLYSKK